MLEIRDPLTSHDFESTATKPRPPMPPLMASRKRLAGSLRSYKRTNTGHGSSIKIRVLAGVHLGLSDACDALDTSTEISEDLS